VISRFWKATVCADLIKHMDSGHYVLLVLLDLSAAWGYRGGSPTAVRPNDPALCGSCPLVTPY